MRGADYARLLTLAALWGGSFVFMRWLAPVLGPLVTADLRILIAGLMLIAYFRFLRFDGEFRLYWKEYLFIGIVNSALPFTLYAYAALHIPAAYSAIFNATAPLFGTVFGAWWLGEKLSAVKFAGLGLGLAGVAMVAGVGATTVDADFHLAALACLAAAMCYALVGIYLKKRAGRIKPLAIAGWSQFLAGAVMLPVLPAFPPPGEVTLAIVLGAVAFALLCSAVAYVLYYRLMADVGPSKALTVTFLLPVFGTLWGWLLLGEAVTLTMMAGCALVICGTALITKGWPWPRRATA